MLALARKVVIADRFVREGKFKKWEIDLFLGQDIHGKSLGIIGLGRIGKAVARRAQGFMMELFYYDIKRDKEAEMNLKISYLPLNELLSRSSFITLHLPLLPSTQHLIGEKEFSIMKPTAFLINTSRGAVIDEKALIKALKNGEIAGAALDVYENEPEMPQELIKMDQVVLTPHIASASAHTRTQMSLIAARSIIDFFEGRRPTYCVNPEVWEKEQ